MTASAPSRVTVVGVPAQGWSGLGDQARAVLSEAAVVVGSGRLLALLPPAGAQERGAWPTPFSVDLLEEYADRAVVVLASGDPLLSGVGTTLLRRYGATRVDVLPAVSSVALARARMGWSAEETEVVSLVGRSPDRVARWLAPGRRVVVMSADEHTPAAVAALLRDRGYGASRLTALGDLGSDRESRHEAIAEEWDHEVPRLHVLAIRCAGPALGGWASGLPDDAFEHDGQLTKRDLRASALARLAPQPGQLLWDVGAGAGSIGIEWMRAHPACRAIAVEADPERAERVGRNARRLGVPDLRVVTGRAPDALAGLPDPDACFVGGGATDAVLDLAHARLSPGGRLVAHAVTLETEQRLVRRHEVDGGELVRLSVERAEPLGRHRGWSPARPVVQWTWVRP